MASSEEIKRQMDSNHKKMLYVLAGVVSRAEKAIGQLALAETNHRKRLRAVLHACGKSYGNLKAQIEAQEEKYGAMKQRLQELEEEYQAMKQRSQGLEEQTVPVQKKSSNTKSEVKSKSKVTPKSKRKRLEYGGRKCGTFGMRLRSQGSATRNNVS